MEKSENSTVEINGPPSYAEVMNLESKPVQNYIVADLTRNEQLFRNTDPSGSQKKSFDALDSNKSPSGFLDGAEEVPTASHVVRMDQNFGRTESSLQTRDRILTSQEVERKYKVAILLMLGILIPVLILIIILVKPNQKHEIQRDGLTMDEGTRETAGLG